MKLNVKMYLTIISMTLFFLLALLLIQMYVTSDHYVSGDQFASSDQEISATATDTSNWAQDHPNKLANHNTKSLPPTTATLVGIGDILIHGIVYKDAQIGTSYNFKPMLAQVKPYIERADIAFANQETMIGGAQLGLSTYPTFNSPFEVGDALKDAGVDIVSMANNHTLDRGEKAIQNAIQHWNKIGMAYTGSFSSEDDKQIIRTLKANDITFSFLAYTYGTNGIPVPNGKPYLVNLINLENMKKEIAEAKSISDVVVVSVHFGNEYQRQPSDQQKQLVKELANAGANIILGHHPHVLQPTDWIERDDGQKTFVIYSLGNFLSGQKGIYKEIGGILQVDVEKTVGGNGVEIEIKNPAFLPTIVTKTSASKYTVVPLKNVYNTDSSIYKDIYHHMTQWMPELTIIE
ncbi:MAG TPA: CapA family protein [Bacillus bacterium]|nr:CapA family protein [Bacillus sp. (in: firmicutes)]